jgi:hypothetical protein
VETFSRNGFMQAILSYWGFHPSLVFANGSEAIRRMTRQALPLLALRDRSAASEKQPDGHINSRLSNLSYDPFLL